MGKLLRVGIVSANWGATAHLPAWRALGDAVEVTAICTSRDETAQAAAAQHGIPRWFSDYTAMCADPDIDIIDAGTSPLLREKIISCALENGKHAVNNLPFATNAAAATRLAELQQHRGVVGGAASSLMGLPHLELMHQMIEAGEIGEVFQVDCSWELGFFLNIMPGFPYTWFGKGGLGVGLTRNHGSHMLHAMRYLFGTIDEVSANITTQLPVWTLPDGSAQAVETDDSCHALVQFTSGVMGSLRASWIAADSPGFSLDVKGSKGRLRLNSLLYPSVHSASLYHARASLALTPSGSEVPLPEALLAVRGQLLQPEPSDLMNGGQRLSIARVFNSVVEAIHHGGEPLPSFVRAAEIQGVVDALHHSHDTRSWIRPA